MCADSSTKLNVVKSPGTSALPKIGDRTELTGVWFSSALSTLLPSHHHAGIEINLLMSGSVRYRLAEQVNPLEAVAGQCLVLPAGVVHQLVSASSDVTMWVVELGTGVNLPAARHPRVFSPHPDWRFQVVSTARKLWLRPGPRASRDLESQLLHALGKLEDAGSLEPPILHAGVLRAMRVCEGLGPGELSVEAIASESKLSASRLAHLFAEQIGISPLQYRNFARVQRFIQSYNGHNRDLLGGAIRAGFGSYAQFHRVFRQVCAASPAAHFEWMRRFPQVNARRTLGTATLCAAGVVPTDIRH